MSANFYHSDEGLTASEQGKRTIDEIVNDPANELQFTREELIQLVEDLLTQFNRTENLGRFAQTLLKRIDEVKK